MMDLLADQFRANTMPELIAVLLAIAYLLLAVRQNIWCWPAALVSTAIFFYVFWDVSLYMETGLQVYYLAMAVYGWYRWTRPVTGHDALPITTWTLQSHVLAITLIGGATLVSGYLLQGTDAAMPYLDAFTTWAAVVTTWMVAQKILENWAYWLVIDSISIYLYLDRELYFTSLLFVVYIVIIVFGWISWQRSYNQVKESAL